MNSNLYQFSILTLIVTIVHFVTIIMAKHICEKIADGDQLNIQGVLKYYDHVRLVESDETYLVNISRIRKSTLEKYNLLQLYDATEEETGLESARWLIIEDPSVVSATPTKPEPVTSEPTSASRGDGTTSASGKEPVDQCKPLPRSEILANRNHWVAGQDRNKEWGSKCTNEGAPLKRMNMLVGHSAGNENYVLWRHFLFMDGSSRMEGTFYLGSEPDSSQIGEKQFEDPASADHRLLSVIGNGYTASGYMMHFNEYIPKTENMNSDAIKEVIDRRRVVITPLHNWQELDSKQRPLRFPEIDAKGYMKPPAEAKVSDRMYFIETNEDRSKVIFVRAKPNADGVVEAAKGDNDRDLFLNLPFGFIHGRGTEMHPDMGVYLFDRFGKVMLAFRYQILNGADRIEAELFVEKRLIDFMICAPAAKLGITGQRRNCISRKDYVLSARAMNLDELNNGWPNSKGWSAWHWLSIFVGVVLIGLIITFMVVQLLRRRGKVSGGGRASKSSSTSKSSSNSKKTTSSKKSSTKTTSAASNKRKASVKSARTSAKKPSQRKASTSKKSIAAKKK